MQQENSYSNLWIQIKKYLKLNIEYARLTASEKLTVFLATAVIALGIALFGIIFVFFLSLAVVNWLAPAIGFALSYVIMSGFYLLLIVLLYIFRRELIFNPVAKFISKLFFK